MISFSHSSFFTSIFLIPFALTILFVALMFVKKIVGNILKIFENHHEFKRRMKEVEAMKARGESHDWLLMAISAKQQTYVCTKTGWCPETYGFYNVDYVKALQRERIRAIEYGKFRDRRIEEIGEEFGISADKINHLVDRIISIPKEFHVQKLDDLAKEFKAIGKKNE
jgi:hypothetical protein